MRNFSVGPVLSRPVPTALGLRAGSSVDALLFLACAFVDIAEITPVFLFNKCQLPGCESLDVAPGKELEDRKLIDFEEFPIVRSRPNL